MAIIINHNINHNTNGGGVSTKVKWGGITGNIEDQTDLTEFITDAVDAGTEGCIKEHQPIKTINGESMVGEGDIEIKGGKPSITLTLNAQKNGFNLDAEFQKLGKNASNLNDVDVFVNIDGKIVEVIGKYNLNKATNILFYDGSSILYNVAINSFTGAVSMQVMKTENVTQMNINSYLRNYAPISALTGMLKEGDLKTINGESIVGQGDITIQGGDGKPNFYFHLNDELTEVIDDEDIHKLIDFANEGGSVDQCNIYYDMGGGAYMLVTNASFSDGAIQLTISIGPNTATIDFTYSSGEMTGSDINITEIGTIVDEIVEQKGFLTEHQPIKTINNQSLIGEGNINIQGGGGSLTPEQEQALNIVADPKLGFLYADGVGPNSFKDEFISYDTFDAIGYSTQQTTPGELYLYKSPYFYKFNQDTLSFEVLNYNFTTSRIGEVIWKDNSGRFYCGCWQIDEETGARWLISAMNESGIYPFGYEDCALFRLGDELLLYFPEGYFESELYIFNEETQGFEPCNLEKRDYEIFPAFYYIDGKVIANYIAGNPNSCVQLVKTGDKSYWWDYIGEYFNMNSDYGFIEPRYLINTGDGYVYLNEDYGPFYLKLSSDRQSWEYVEFNYEVWIQQGIRGVTSIGSYVFWLHYSDAKLINVSDTSHLKINWGKPSDAYVTTDGDQVVRGTKTFTDPVYVSKITDEFNRAWLELGGNYNKFNLVSNGSGDIRTAQNLNINCDNSNHLNINNGETNITSTQNINLNGGNGVNITTPSLLLNGNELPTQDDLIKNKVFDLNKPGFTPYGGDDINDLIALNYHEHGIYYSDIFDCGDGVIFFARNSSEAYQLYKEGNNLFLYEIALPFNITWREACLRKTKNRTFFIDDASQVWEYVGNLDDESFLTSESFEWRAEINTDYNHISAIGEMLYNTSDQTVLDFNTWEWIPSGLQIDYWGEHGARCVNVGENTYYVGEYDITRFDGSGFNEFVARYSGRVNNQSFTVVGDKILFFDRYNRPRQFDTTTNEYREIDLLKHQWQYNAYFVFDDKLFYWNTENSTLGIVGGYDYNDPYMPEEDGVYLLAAQREGDNVTYLYGSTEDIADKSYVEENFFKNESLFIGTEEEWNSLSDEQKESYTIALIK